MKEETKLRHWLHIILVLLTGGLWLAVYGILIAVNEMNNRVVRGYNQGWKDAQVSVSQRDMGFTWWGTPFAEAIRANGKGRQAAMTQDEGEEYRNLVSSFVAGEPMSFEQHQRFEHLRSRFK